MKKLLFVVFLLGGGILMGCTPKDIETNVSSLTMQVGDSFLLETYHINKIHRFAIKSECDYCDSIPNEPKNVIRLEAVKKKTNVMVHALKPGEDTVVVYYFKAGVGAPLDQQWIPVSVKE